MSENTLAVKNMVCPRCIMVVESLLNQLNIEYEEVRLGEIKLKQPIKTQVKELLEKEIEKLGFEVLNDKKTQMIERIKNAIVHMVHHQENPEMIGHLSEQLPPLLNTGYSTLSKLFSEVEGVTIEKYLILQKIEKAKEFIVYDELSLSEISYRLNYSSVQHFSKQFKSVTGMTPSAFKTQREERKSLNDI